MKRILLLFCILVLLITPAMATGTEGDSSDVTEPVVSDGTSDPDDLSGDSTILVTQPTVLEAAQSGDGVSVMADVIRNVLGEYQRQTYTVQELDQDGNVIAVSTKYVEGLAGLDYVWLAGAAAFLLFFSGAFKLLGGLIR